MTQQYKSSEDFILAFTISETDWKFFEQMAAKDSINLSGIALKEKQFLSKSLKTSIARQLFRTEGYYKAMNAVDNNIKKALEILNR